jgi:hypothetical protein
MQHIIKYSKITKDLLIQTDRTGIPGKQSF